MRVYIAKSNKANPEYLLKIRDFLSKFKSVQILEYQGGGYDNTDLISSDILIVIPDLSEGIKDKRVVLGKGLYMQIDDFINHQSIDGLFIVTGIDKSGKIDYAYINEVTEDDDFNDDYMEVLDGCNYIKYGVVNIAPTKYSLQETITEVVLIDDTSHYTEKESEDLWSKYITRLSSTSNRYKYLLIQN